MRHPIYRPTTSHKIRFTNLIKYKHITACRESGHVGLTALVVNMACPEEQPRPISM